jgi:hypothetical protein
MYLSHYNEQIMASSGLACGSGLAEPQQANFHEYVVSCKFDYSTANSVAKTGISGITSMSTTYVPT